MKNNLMKMIAVILVLLQIAPSIVYATDFNADTISMVDSMNNDVLGTIDNNYGDIEIQEENLEENIIEMERESLEADSDEQLYKEADEKLLISDDLYTVSNTEEAVDLDIISDSENAYKTIDNIEEDENKPHTWHVTFGDRNHYKVYFSKDGPVDEVGEEIIGDEFESNDGKNLPFVVKTDMGYTPRVTLLDNNNSEDIILEKWGNSDYRTGRFRITSGEIPFTGMRNIYETVEIKVEAVPVAESKFVLMKDSNISKVEVYGSELKDENPERKIINPENVVKNEYSITNTTSLYFSVTPNEGYTYDILVNNVKLDRYGFCVLDGADNVIEIKAYPIHEVTIINDEELFYTFHDNGKYVPNEEGKLYKYNVISGNSIDIEFYNANNEGKLCCAKIGDKLIDSYNSATGSRRFYVDSVTESTTIVLFSVPRSIKLNFGSAIKNVKCSDAFNTITYSNETKEIYLKDDVQVKVEFELDPDYKGVDHTAAGYYVDETLDLAHGFNIGDRVKITNYSVHKDGKDKNYFIFDTKGVFEVGYLFENNVTIDNKGYSYYTGYDVNGSTLFSEKTLSGSRNVTKDTKITVAVIPPFEGYQFAIMDSKGDIRKLDKKSSINIRQLDDYFKIDACDVYEFIADKDYTLVEMRTTSDDSKKVVIDNKLPSNYEVEISDLNEDNTLDITKEGKKVSILRKSGDNLPIVRFSFDDVDTILEPVDRIIVDEAVCYEYFIPFKLIANNTTVILEEDTSEKEIKFIYPYNSIDQPVVNENETKILPVSREIKRKTVTEVYKVKAGSIIYYTFTGNKKYSASSVDVTQNKNTRTIEDVDGKKCSIIPYVDTKVEVKLQRWFNYELDIKSGEEWLSLAEELKGGLGTKDVNIELYPGCEYRFELLLGNDNLENQTGNVKTGYKLDKSSLVNLLTRYPGIIEINDKSPYLIKVSEKAVTGSKFTFMIEFSEYNKYQFNFSIVEDPKAIGIYGLLDGGVIQAQVDVNRNVSFNSKLNMSLFEAEIQYVKPEYESLIEIKKVSRKDSSKYSIETSPNIPLGDIATIKFYRKHRKPGDTDYYYKFYNSSEKNNSSRNEFESIKIVAVEPKALVSSDVCIKEKEQDDTYFYFDIIQSYDKHENIYGPIKGMQYYEVKMIPKVVAGKTMPPQIRTKYAYIERDFGAEDEWFDPQREKQDAEWDKKYPEGTDKEIEYVFKDFVSHEKVKASDFPDYYGMGWPYDVEISLVQTVSREELTEDNASELIRFRSAVPFKANNWATKDPVYETNISVAKKASQIYTGQNNAIIGDVKYSKATVCKSALAEDITDCRDDEKISVYVEDGKVIASIPVTARLGDHEVEVSPVGPAFMYKQSKTLKIKVVKGIENLEITLPSTRIYKARRKSASLKASAKFNVGMSAPAVKNLKWEITDGDGNPLYSDDEDSERNIRYVSITNNGQINIRADYDIENNGTFSFFVKATGADYKGSEVFAISEEILVADHMVTPERIKIAKYDEDSNDWTYYDDDKKNFYTNELKNAYIFVDGDNVSAGIDLSTSNKNVSIYRDDNGNKIIVNAIANNVKITAKSNDGGNRSISKTINIINYEPSEMKLLGSISDNCIGTENQKEWSFDGTVNTQIRLQLRQKNSSNNTYSDVDAATKHKINIKGGKIISGNAIDGAYYVVVTSPEAKVTFTDNKNKKSEYIIKNNTYSVETSKKNVPVKASYMIKDTKVNGIVEGVASGRKVDITIDKRKYDSKDKIVFVEMDVLTYAKNKSNYSAFEDACQQINTYVPISSNMISLNFNEKEIKKGTYSVVLTLGKMDNGKFVADAKPVTIKLSAKQPVVKKGSCNSIKAITLSKLSGSSGKISFTGKYNSVSVNAIQNVNINGKSNNFSEYFDTKDVIENGEKVTKIELRTSLSKEQLDYITGKDGKNDRFFYITYTYTHGDNGYGEPNKSKKSVKCEVKFK